jgi:hypothetical protein
MTVTVLQGTMNFATGDNVQLNLNGGDLIVDGSNAVVNVGGGETTDRQKLLTNGTTADITVQNGGELNVGNGTYGDIRFDGNAGTMLVTGTGSEVNCGRIVTGNNAGNGGTLTISNDAIMRVRQSATTAGTAVFFRGTSTINVQSGAEFLIGNPADSTGNLNADQDNSFARNMTVDGNATVRVYGRWLASGGVNNTNTIFNINNGSQFIVSENVINVAVAAEACNLGRATINVNSGSTVRLFQNAQSANNVNVCVIGAGGVGSLNINDGLFEVFGGTNVENLLFTGNTAMQVLGTLNVGDGSGAPESARLYIGQNTLPELPNPVNRRFLDIEPGGQMIVQNDAEVLIGGGNRGTLQLVGNATYTQQGGIVNVRASFQLGNGSLATVNNGELNVGVNQSNGGNSITFPVDVAAVTRFILNGGTVNVGDGNSSFGSLTAAGNFGNGNNNPAFAGANYASLEITGGTLNLNGRFTLNDANYRFIMSGGAFNINPSGDQDITGTQNALSFTRGIVQHSGGTITIVNPNPNAGGNNTTTGVSFRTSPLGNPDAGANLTGSTTVPSSNTCFTGTSVIRFGDGVSTTPGSVEGFEVCLHQSHNYNNFVVNNPSGNNRFVWLYTPDNNQTLNFNGNFTVIVGEVRQGRPATPAVPNVLVQGIGGVFTLGNNALYRIYNTATGNPAPIYGTDANYSIDFNSTIEYMSDAPSGQNVSLPSDVEFGNLTISGPGTRTVTSGNAVRNTLTLNQGVLNVGTGNLTMRNNSRLVRAGTNASGILQANNALGQAAGDLFRIIYRGVSKNFLNEEFTGAGNKSLEVDLNVGETVTQNDNRTIVDLFLTQGTLNDDGYVLSVTGNISGNATHTSTGNGRIQLTGTGAQTISNAPTLGNFRLNKSNGSTSLAPGASPTITGVFDIDQDNGANSGILDIGDNQLSFGLSASTTGTFNANRKIRLSGLLTALGVRKNFQSGQTFTFPIGVSARYTPARLSITAATGTDFITVTPIAQEAPTNSAALALQYYWRVEAGTNITVTNISHAYQYENSDVENVLADTASYQAGRFNTSTAQWTALTINEVDGNLDLDGNPITTGGRIRFPNVNYADGLFTAGEGAKFNNGTVVPYYSVANATGDWNAPASWRTDGHTGSNVPTGPPSFDNPVFIDQNSVIYLNTTLQQAVPSVTIGATGRLRLDVNPGSASFGSVTGTGTLELRDEDDDNDGIQFPVGAFTSFLGVTGGTVEYGGAQNYTLPTVPTGYRNLVISGNGTTKTFPAQELTLSGNLTVQDGATALLSNDADGDIIITGDAVGGGNLTITGTGSTLRFTNDNERLVEVRRNVTIGAGATFDVATTGTPVENLLVIGDNTSALGGNLVNNGTFDMNAGSGRIANVVFRGTGNASITGTGGTTEFHRLIVNKGMNQTATLTVPDAATLANFALTAPANTPLKPLAIQNGTFIFNRPTATLELSSGGGNFTIPTTGALQVGGGTVQLSSTSGHDLILNGRLRITGGTVNIGTDVSGVSQNSIIYQSQSPSAELLVEGGTLTVATGIRANGGILNYTQSGGTVTVGRYSTENGSPIFGIATGGQFNMTGPNAVLNIVRGRNSANDIADLLIGDVASPTAPQGTIQIFTTDTPVNAVPSQQGFIYDINSNVRLPNVNIGVGQDVNYNVGSRSGAGTQTLDIRGNLTINTTGTCQVRLWRINGNTAQDVQSVTVGGNFTLISGTIVMANASTFNVRGNFAQNGGNFNQGTAPNASLLVGGNFTLAGGTFNTFVNTTFNGNTTPQVITRTGGSPTTLTFQNFTINNTATGGTIQLGPGTDLIITGNWTTTAGAFDAQTNTRTVTFSGTAAQTITGTTDFYNLTINNGAGVTLASGTLGIRNTQGSGGTLTLQNGILNIGNNPLIIRNTDAVGVIGGTPSASAMISTSGTAAAAGVTKVYGGAQSFTFPIGTASPFAIYTPATINVTNLGTGGAGSITVAPVRAAHPQAVTATGRINYYWRTTQTGFDEESIGFSVTHTYVATTAVGNLGGDLANYVGAYYIGSPAFQWNFLPVPPNTPDPNTFDDQGTFTIGAPTPGTTNRITGDFTAGEGLINPTVFYSVRNGNWDVVTGVGTTTWSTNPVTEIPPGVLPNAGNPVVIRNGHVVNTNGSGRTSASLTFATGGGTLVISSASTGHNFGTVSSSGGGAGTIRFDQNVATTPTFPTATLEPSFLANGTIEYSGTGSYTLPTTGVPNPYPSLAFSGSGIKTLPAGATNVSLNLTLSGTVTVAMGTNTMNRTSVGGTMTMGASTTLTLTGTNNFPANYGTYSLATTSTVDYTANANQTIAAVTYGNLTLTKTGGATSETKTLAGATTVAGNLLVRRTGGTGNLTFATNNHNLTVGGNFTLNNALPVTEFNGGTSTVTFNGTGAQTITRTGGGTLTFNNMTVNKSGGTLTLETSTLSSTLSVPGTLTLTSGAFTIGGSTSVPNTLALGGTVSGSGTITGSSFSDMSITGTGALGTLNFTSGGQTLRRLSVNRTGTSPTITLGTELSVGGSTSADTLSLISGIIQTGSNVLTLANQSQFGHGSPSAFVDGILRMTYPTATVARFFPIAGDGIYRPVLVSGSAAAGAQITVRMINTAPPGTPGTGLNNLSGVRYYRIDRSGTFGGTPRVQLSINTVAPVDEFASNPSGLTVASTTDNPPTGSTVWQAGGSPSATFTPFPAAIMSADITSLSSSSPVFVTAASTVPNDNPLPVELISFAITAVDEGVKLKWETASEVENAGFILSRSRFRDGGFEELASYRTHEALVGKGTSATGGKYEWIDKSKLLPGETYYYKLEDVDFNGVIHTTEIKEFVMPKEYSLSQNYPNPFNSSTVVEFNLRMPGRTVLEVYNVLGQRVMTVVDGELSAGSYRYQVNLSGLASGMYLYRLRSRDFVATKKMLLIK